MMSGSHQKLFFLVLIFIFKTVESQIFEKEINDLEEDLDNDRNFTLEFQTLSEIEQMEQEQNYLFQGFSVNSSQGNFPVYDPWVVNSINLQTTQEEYINIDPLQEQSGQSTDLENLTYFEIASSSELTEENFDILVARLSSAAILGIQYTEENQQQQQQEQQQQSKQKFEHQKFCDAAEERGVLKSRQSSLQPIFKPGFQDPYRNIGRVFCTEQSITINQCTGVYIGDKGILTARNCVLNCEKIFFVDVFENKYEVDSVHSPNTAQFNENEKNIAVLFLSQDLCFGITSRFKLKSEYDFNCNLNVCGYCRDEMWINFCPFVPEVVQIPRNSECNQLGYYLPMEGMPVIQVCRDNGLNKIFSILGIAVKNQMGFLYVVDLTVELIAFIRSLILNFHD